MRVFIMEHDPRIEYSLAERQAYLPEHPSIKFVC